MDHSCKTYFSFFLPFDREKNAALLKERRGCTPEEIGIFNKTEIEREIINAFGTVPLWRRHRFIIGYNETYDTDVNQMLRTTLSGLFGKEEKIRTLCERYFMSATLEIVPYIKSDSDDPKPYLSPEQDIIAFLYLSGAALDLDYYVV